MPQLDTPTASPVPPLRPPSLTAAADIEAIVAGRHADPFAVLGPHAHGAGTVIRTFQPGASRVEIIDATGRRIGELALVHDAGLFAGTLAAPVRVYRLRLTENGATRELDDAYRFPSVLGEMDDYLMGEGTHRRLWEKLGSQFIVHEGVAGVQFAVWAPNASRVSVVGDFNGWDGRRSPMRKRLTGVWELFVPEVGHDALYKYELLDAGGGLLPLKADPLAQGAELRPSTASRVATAKDYAWGDAAWLAARGPKQSVAAPISIYEVHLGSWQRGEGNRFLTFDELGDRLIPYVQELGFTHLELLPVSEYPFDGSWGYQPVGLFAVTARHGGPADFARFVDRCHAAGLGVLIDWVAGHFPTDPHGLGRFDGTALYEHEDPRRGFHPDWNTLVYNFGRAEVANFLLANALYWYDRFHLDGLRVDAVASMLYLDYSRKAGEWLPNAHGGRENLEAVDFLRRLNELTYAADPSIMSVAEESTAWPGVSRPTWTGGLGFGFKWNMGWMNDTLDYIGRDPIHRRYHHHQLTFGLHYAFSENFILPLSHDEVVHGKGSILARMPGDPWQQFANLRAYYGFMWGHPGKKLLFMGQEFAQGAEWHHDHSLDWHQDRIPAHGGIKALVRDLNQLYRATPALHQRDCSPEGFEWIEANDADHSVFVWLRKGEAGSAPVVCVANFTPVPHENYRIGLPTGGHWRERLNTDAAIYGGSNMGNGGGLIAENLPHHGRPFSAPFTIPPLATVFFEHSGP